MDLPVVSLRRRPSPELVACYRDEFAAVWRALVRLGVPRSECDDAAQEVFVTAHRRWNTLRDPSKRRPWLFAIVRRVAWRTRRTHDRRERRHEAYGQAPHEAITLDDAVADREAWSALAGFLDTLDEDKRAAFVLGELEELSRTELGEALGINSNTAYSRLSAARRSFLAHFAAYDDDRLAQLFVHASACTEPPPAARSHGWTGIVAAIGHGTKLATWAGLALAGLVTTAAVVTHVARNDTAVHVAVEEPATPRDPLPQPIAVIAAAPPTIVSPRATTPASTPAPSASAAHHAAATVEPTATVDAEVRLLVAARAALASGDLATARRRLDEHHASYGEASRLHELRARIEHDLAAASIDSKASGDSIVVETPR